MPLSALLLPHVSAQAAAQLASDKSALSNPSAAPFHISYLISHNFQRPQGAKERIKK